MNSSPLTAKTTTIFVTEVTGDNLCIMCECGKKLYEHIAIAFNAGDNVILSFKDAEDLTSAFLAEAFYQLYAHFPAETIETSLQIVDIHPDDAMDINYVIRDVKEYLQNPLLFQNAICAVMGDDYL
ncbi:STAS-like domain-containing protein [Calothrix sp. 336/3]|uniref:STAS-like domain-containing protein n=1 Tax=Calothrix sp. 336/3 TaxID=1337936 RepID=UPI0004E2A001|nr:STAS-like domain-containing protein [Calothrix sp. 336/3]AKG24231.1 hypothetical protein IJ00_25555 [Calothrix sp. 336/3]